jgi:hypothetical protein
MTGAAVHVLLKPQRRRLRRWDGGGDKLAEGVAALSLLETTAWGNAMGRRPIPGPAQ